MVGVAGSPGIAFIVVAAPAAALHVLSAVSRASTVYAPGIRDAKGATDQEVPPSIDFKISLYIFSIVLLSKKYLEIRKYLTFENHLHRL